MSEGMASLRYLYKFSTKTKMHVGAYRNSSAYFTNSICMKANASWWQKPRVLYLLSICLFPIPPLAQPNILSICWILHALWLMPEIGNISSNPIPLLSSCLLFKRQFACPLTQKTFSDFPNQHCIHASIIINITLWQLSLYLSYCPALVPTTQRTAAQDNDSSAFFL